MEKNQELLEKGSFGKLVLSLCIPTVVIMVVMVLYHMADTYFIGQTGDPNKMAAVSLCTPVFSILTGLGTLFGSGGCTAISIALGKRENEKTRSYASLCFLGSILIGVLFMIGGSLFAPQMCVLLGANEVTFGYTAEYLRIIAFGAPFITFSNVFMNLIRADGAAVQSMIANAIGTVSNILLDAVFVLGFSWGVSGVAFATVLGNVLSCCYLAYYICKKNRLLKPSMKEVSFKKEIVMPVLTLGMPLSCSTLLMSVSTMLANKLMMHYGTIPVAAQGVASRIGMLISMLVMGLCMGFQPAISYNYGRGNRERLYEMVRKIAIFTVVVGTTLMIVIFVFRRPMVAAFIDDLEVVTYGEKMLVASLIIGPFYGIYQLCQTFLQSTGKVSYAVITALLDKGIVYIPMLLILNYLFGVYGIVYAVPVTLAFSVLAGVFLSLKWNKQMPWNTVENDSEKSRC